MFLEVKNLFFIKLPKRNATRHQNSCSLRNTKHFPAKTLKEGCKMCLASGFSPTRASSQHKLVYSFCRWDRIFYFQVFHLVFLVFFILLVLFVLLSFCLLSFCLSSIINIVEKYSPWFSFRYYRVSYYHSHHGSSLLRKKSPFNCVA